MVKTGNRLVRLGISVDRLDGSTVMNDESKIETDGATVIINDRTVVFDKLLAGNNGDRVESNLKVVNIGSNMDEANSYLSGSNIYGVILSYNLFTELQVKNK